MRLSKQNEESARGGWRRVCAFALVLLLAFPVLAAQALVGNEAETAPTPTASTRDEVQESYLQKVASGETPEETEEQAWGETKKPISETLSAEEQSRLQEDIRRRNRMSRRRLFLGRERILLGGDFDMTYDSNPNRLPIHHVEGDTLFNVRPFGQLNLGGRKTDARLEVSVQRLYHAKVAEDDSFALEGRFRFGRKIAKKTMVSLNDRLTMGMTREPGMDDNSLSLDEFHRQAINYIVTPKVSINVESIYGRNDFQHENFDQNASITYRLEPSLFFQITPKTRFSLGYSWGFNRARTKASDQDINEIRFGYFGQLTGKSSLSTNVTYQHGDPMAAEAAKSDSLITSFNYIWQATSKLTVRSLYSHAYSTNSSDQPGVGFFANTGTYNNSDTLSLSLRLRALRKLTPELSFNGIHTREHTHFNGTKSAERRRWLFPVQIAIDYQLARWIRLRFAYTFTYQVGDERKFDEFRAHTWFFGSNVTL
jgi:hypothetical protein